MESPCTSADEAKMPGASMARSHCLTTGAIFVLVVPACSLASTVPAVLRLPPEMVGAKDRWPSSIVPRMTPSVANVGAAKGEASLRLCPHLYRVPMITPSVMTTVKAQPMSAQLMTVNDHMRITVSKEPPDMISRTACSVFAGASLSPEARKSSWRRHAHSVQTNVPSVIKNHSAPGVLHHVPRSSVGANHHCKSRSMLLMLMSVINAIHWRKRTNTPPNTAGKSSARMASGAPSPTVGITANSEPLCETDR